MRPEVGTGGRQGYARALAGVYGDLAHTLSRLEAVAADPDETLTDGPALDELPSLQYGLHAAGEAVAGLRPPPGAEASHAELASALAEARDATAEIADIATASGPDAAWPLVWEWRGALFRVRLAHSRLSPRPAPEEAAQAERSSARFALATTALVLLAATTVCLAAILGSWLLGAAALLIAAGSLLAPRQ